MLGLPVAEHNDFACVLDANGVMLRVTAVPEVRQAGYTVLGWRVADIAAAVWGLAAGVWSSCGMTGWTRTATVSGALLAGDKVAWFADPDGNVLSLTQFL